MRTIIMGALVLAILGLIGSAGYDYYSYKHASTLHSKFTWGEFPEFVSGETTIIPILVDNQSGAPVRVVGFLDC